MSRAIDTESSLRNLDTGGDFLDSLRSAVSTPTSSTLSSSTSTPTSLTSTGTLAYDDYESYVSTVPNPPAVDQHHDHDHDYHHRQHSAYYDSIATGSEIPDKPPPPPPPPVCGRVSRYLTPPEEESVPDMLSALFRHPGWGVYRALIDRTAAHNVGSELNGLGAADLERCRQMTRVEGIDLEWRPAAAPPAPTPYQTAVAAAVGGHTTSSTTVIPGGTTVVINMTSSPYAGYQVGPPGPPMGLRQPQATHPHPHPRGESAFATVDQTKVAKQAELDRQVRDTKRESQAQRDHLRRAQELDAVHLRHTQQVEAEHLNQLITDRAERTAAHTERLERDRIEAELEKQARTRRRHDEDRREEDERAAQRALERDRPAVVQAWADSEGAAATGGFSIPSPPQHYHHHHHGYAGFPVDDVYFDPDSTKYDARMLAEEAAAVEEEIARAGVVAEEEEETEETVETVYLDPRSGLPLTGAIRRMAEQRAVMQRVTKEREAAEQAEEERLANLNSERRRSRAARPGRASRSDAVLEELDRRDERVWAQEDWGGRRAGPPVDDDYYDDEPEMDPGTRAISRARREEEDDYTYGNYYGHKYELGQDEGQN